MVSISFLGFDLPFLENSPQNFDTPFKIESKASRALIRSSTGTFTPPRLQGLAPPQWIPFVSFRFSGPYTS